MLTRLRLAVSRVANARETQALPLLERSLLPVLTFASLVHATIVLLRFKLYQWGIFKPVRLPIPVISIGNVSWGGNGKTPMVEYLAWKFLESGFKPLILTRGYAGGDEVKLIRCHLCGSGALLGVGKNRARIACTLIRRHGLMGVDARAATVLKLECSSSSLPLHFDNFPIVNKAKQDGIGIILLDDGMQHWQMKRDVEIVMVNAISPFGNEKLVPRGPLREPLSALSRADLVIIHNANLVSSEEVLAIKSRLMALTGFPIAIFCSQLVPRILIRFPSTPLWTDSNWDCYIRKSNMVVPLGVLEGRHILSISGIGCPESLYLTLKQLVMAASIERLDFPDHHEFQSKDIDMINLKILTLCTKSKSLPVVITTEKDYLRNPAVFGRLQTHYCDAFFLHSTIEVFSDTMPDQSLGFFIATKIKHWEQHSEARAGLPSWN